MSRAIGQVDAKPIEVCERKIGTEIFVTVATVIAMIGGEYVAGSVLLNIILIAEFIAEFNTDRARASIKALIGSVPQVALVRWIAERQADLQASSPSSDCGDEFI